MEAKILVVDDGLDSWNLLSSILRTHRYQPIWSADGIQALNEARKRQPHVILLDLGLPGGDGFVVLERLKSNRLLSASPVIVVTVRDPAGGGAKGPGVWSDRIPPEAREGGRIDRDHPRSSW